MDISTLANLINAIAVTAGVIFAAVQIWQYRQRRQRDAMAALVRSFQTPSFAHALRRVSSLPDRVAREQISQLLGADGEDHVYSLLTSWEALAILLYHKEVTLDLVDDFFSGPIIVTWRKLSKYIEDTRTRATACERHASRTCCARRLFVLAKTASAGTSNAASAQHDCSIVDVFASEIGGDFSQYRLAKAFLRWSRDHNASDLSDEERAAWKRLIEKINTTLK